MPIINNVPQDHPAIYQHHAEIHHIQKINLNEPIMIDQNGNISQAPSRMNPIPDRYVSEVVQDSPSNTETKKQEIDQSVNVIQDDLLFEELNNAFQDDEDDD